MPNEPPNPTSVWRRLSTALLVVVTIGAAGFAGWTSLHDDSGQTSVLIVIGAAFAITVLFSRGGWLAGFLTGFGVPLARLYARVAHVPLPHPMPAVWQSFWVLIPALGGMITGLALRTGVRHVRR